MKSPTWNDKLIYQDDEFKYYLCFEVEIMDSKHHFMSECGWSKHEYKDIRNFYWFSARIEARKGAIVCGESYLGANCYKDLKGVLGDGQVRNILSGYAPDLLEEAKENAQYNINQSNEVIL